MKIKSPTISDNLPVVPLEDALMEAGENETDLRSMRFEGDTVEELNIENIEFISCSFFACRFRDCTFHRCTFIDCVIEGCDFSLNNMSESSFVRCSVSGGKFLGTGLDGGLLMQTVFQDVNCEYINLTSSSFKTARFEGCNLGNAGLDYCQIKNIELTDCVLTGANFAHTPLNGVDISSCELGGLTFAGGELRGAIISAFQSTELVKLLGVVLADYDMGSSEEDEEGEDELLSPEN